MPRYGFRKRKNWFPVIGRVTVYVLPVTTGTWAIAPQLGALRLALLSNPKRGWPVVHLIATFAPDRLMLNTGIEDLTVMKLVFMTVSAHIWAVITCKLTV
jgi:hypothetical protein